MLGWSGLGPSPPEVTQAIKAGQVWDSVRMVWIQEAHKPYLPFQTHLPLFPYPLLTTAQPVPAQLLLYTFMPLARYMFPQQGTLSLRNTFLFVLQSLTKKQNAKTK